MYICTHISVPIRQFSIFPSHYKPGKYPFHHCIFLLFTERPNYSKAMDNSVQKDEKNDTVQMCQDQDHQLPQANNLTRSATTENLQIENSKPRDNQSADEPYSIYSQRTKRFLIISVSFMAIISPLSAAVYLPAIPQIGHDLNVSPSLINLTITTYMVSFPSFYQTFRLKLMAFTYRYFKASPHPSLEPSLILTVVDLRMSSVELYISQPI